MNRPIHQQMHQRLLNFYFGTLEESERLELERELLEDSELLVDYLDLKRALESAAVVPSVPASLRERLFQVYREKPARVIVPFSLGIVLAACLVLFLFLSRAPKSSAPARGAELLFDGRVEPSSSSSVL